MTNKNNDNATTELTPMEVARGDISPEAKRFSTELTEFLDKNREVNLAECIAIVSSLVGQMSLHLIEGSVADPDVKSSREEITEAVDKVIMSNVMRGRHIGLNASKMVVDMLRSVGKTPDDFIRRAEEIGTEDAVKELMVEVGKTEAEENTKR